MKVITTFITLAILLTFPAALVFTACGNNTDYNAVLYDNAVDLINEEFRSKNLISGVHYDAGLADDCPKTRASIISDHEQFESIFNVAEFEIDFEKEMLIVYTFASEYVLPAKITDIELSKKILTITYGIELPAGAGGAVRPFQRWFVVKLDKLDITSAKNSVLIICK